MRRFALLILIWTYAPSDHAWAQSVFYAASPPAVEMGIQEAEQIVVQGFRNMFLFTGRGTGDRIVDVKIDGDSLTLIAWKERTESRHSLREVDPHVIRRNKTPLDEFIISGFAAVLQDSKDRPAPTSKIEFGFLRDEEKSTNPTLAQFSDALLVLKEAAIARAVAAEADADMERFLRSVAAQYRQANPKPTLPEAARRLAVQGRAAIEDKQFEEANRLWRQAVEIAPWWPEGHFNFALGLAGANQFLSAITEMRKYLALVPDAPDAREMQDQIYVWERKVQE